MILISLWSMIMRTLVTYELLKRDNVLKSYNYKWEYSLKEAWAGQVLKSIELHLCLIILFAQSNQFLVSQFLSPVYVSFSNGPSPSLLIFVLGLFVAMIQFSQNKLTEHPTTMMYRDSNSRPLNNECFR